MIIIYLIHFDDSKQATYFKKQYIQFISIVGFILVCLITTTSAFIVFVTKEGKPFTKYDLLHMYQLT